MKTKEEKIKVEKLPVADSGDGSQAPNPYLIQIGNAKRALECCEKELSEAYKEIKRLKSVADQEKQALKEKIIKLVETRKSEVPIGQSYWRACGDILNMLNKL